MSKASVKNIIKQRKMAKFANSSSALDSAKILLNSIEQNFGLAATVGLSCAEFLCALRDGKVPFEKNDLLSYVGHLCNDMMYKIHDIFPDSLPRPLSTQSLVIATTQLLANADLATGLSAPLTPTYENGRLNIEISTTGESMEVTEKGHKFADDAFAGTNIFANPDIYGQTFYNLALRAAKDIVIKLSK